MLLVYYFKDITMELSIANLLIAGAGAAATAVGSGVLAGISDATKKLVVEKFTQLKDKVLQKHNTHELLANTLGVLQVMPDSKDLGKSLHKCAEELDLDSDPDLQPFAKELFDALEKEPQGTQYLNSVVGNYSARDVGDNSTAGSYNTHADNGSNINIVKINT